MQPSTVLSSGPRAHVWRLCLGMLLAAGSAACAQGNVSNGAMATAPTVDSLPSEVATPELGLSGTRPPNTVISARFADGAVQILAIAGDTSSTTWSGTLRLAEGNNAFVLIAQDSAGNVHTSAPYIIVRNPVAPAVPVIIGAYQGLVYVYTALGSAPVLMGSKDPNTSISINGAVAAALDDQTSWQYSLPPLDAQTPLALNVQSANRSGQTSPVVALQVRSTTLPPVVLDAVPSPTNAPQVTFSGSHQAGAVVHAIWQGQSVDTSVTAPDATHFAFAAHLRQTGVVDGILEAVVYQSAGGVQSPYSVVPVRYDVVPPVAPLVASPVNFAQSAPIVVAGKVAPSSLQLAGSLPESGSTLCVGLGAMTPCQIVQGPADTFAISVALDTGDNLIVVSSIDAAGNHSVPVLGHVYVTTPPSFVIDSPEATDLLSGDSVSVSGHVYLTPADALVPSVSDAMAIAAVEVCIDNVTCQTADVQNSVFSALLPLSSLASGSHTIGVHGTTRSGASYIADPKSPGAVTLSYFSAAPTWLNGAQSTVVGARAPQLAVDSAGTAHIVWEDFCPNLGQGCPVASIGSVGPDIFYTSRNAAGVWAKAVQSVSNNGLADGQSRTPSIAIDSAGYVHVAWSDNGTIVQSPNNNYGILHRTLDPASGAWSSVDVVAGQDGHHAKQPQLASNTFSPGSQVHLTWQRDSTPTASPPVRDVYYARQLASPPLVGNTTFGAWSTPLKVTADPNTGTAAFPDVAQGPDGHVSVVWQECRGSACTQSPAVNVVRMVDLADPNTVDPLGSIIINDSLTDRDGVQPAVSVSPDNTRHIIWEGLSETGGANPAISAIFIRSFRGRAPDGRQPSAMWLSQGQSTAARAPWVTGRADGHFAIAWSQATQSASRTSRVAVRLGTMTLGPGPDIILMPDTGSVALHPSIALDPLLPSAAHVVWDNLLTLGAGTSLTTKTGAFYAITATP